MMRIKTKKGLLSAFTLIELLVVISIIGVLTTLVFSNLNAIRERARDTQRKSDLKQYQNALETYANKSGIAAYPNPTPAGVKDASSLCTTIDFVACPEDPQYDSNDADTSTYKYMAFDNGLKYLLWADLETGDDWAVCSEGRSLEVIVPGSPDGCPTPAPSATP